VLLTFDIFKNDGTAFLIDSSLERLFEYFQENPDVVSTSAFALLTFKFRFTDFLTLVVAHVS
jgi:hypothetical protein